MVEMLLPRVVQIARGERKAGTAKAGYTIAITPEGQPSDARFVNVDPICRVTVPDDSPGLTLLLAGGALCNDAVLTAQADQPGHYHTLGDPTEGALVVAAFCRPTTAAREGAGAVSSAGAGGGARAWRGLGGARSPPSKRRTTSRSRSSTWRWG
jgi:hypothetical protein